MAEDTPKDRGNLFENFSQDLDPENEESGYSEMSDPNDPQYETGRSDVDSESDIDLDLDDNEQQRPTYRCKVKSKIFTVATEIVLLLVFSINADKHSFHARQKTRHVALFSLFY